MDNQTPPPGIEVIGDLPPDVPWWDAEELGFVTKRTAIFGFVLVCAWMAYSLGFDALFRNAGSDTFSQRAGLLVAGYMAISALVMAAWLTSRFAVVISCNYLRRKVIQLGMFEIPKTVCL